VKTHFSRHPRAASLATRDALVSGYEKGLVCANGLIAQGRGEAFDYLLGEKTRAFARRAGKAAAAALLLAKSPVISVNGNAAALCPRELVQLSRETGAKLEVNLFYRTRKRIAAIRRELESHGAKGVLGGGRDEASIPELFSERRRVSREGIFSADAVLVPLEDGDRAKALAAMGKTVIAIDLNPLSVTAREAQITVVDNIVRAVPAIALEAARMKRWKKERLARVVSGFDNARARGEALEAICGAAKRAGKVRPRA
jgi:4-phosphopantoate--beta-alanine ligase